MYSNSEEEQKISVTLIAPGAPRLRHMKAPMTDVKAF